MGWCRPRYHLDQAMNGLLPQMTIANVWLISQRPKPVKMAMAMCKETLFLKFNTKANSNNWISIRLPISKDFGWSLIHKTNNTTTAKSRIKRYMEERWLLIETSKFEYKPFRVRIKFHATRGKIPNKMIMSSVQVAFSGLWMLNRK